MKKIAFTGSFDPITKGHLWVVQEGLEIAEKVVLMIAVNPEKKYMFTEDERKKMIYQSLVEYGIEDKVEIVVSKNEYVAQSAIDFGCDYLIRGIRSAVDFDYESLIQKANTEVLGGAKTIFVMPPRDLESVSSSFIKNLLGPVGWHWNIKKFVSNAVYDALIKKYLMRCISKYTGLNLNEESLNKLTETIIDKYKDRTYHNINHIVHCYQELEWYLSNRTTDEKISIEDVGLAILTHDIIYGEKAEKSDEELSAEWTKNYLKSIGVERDNVIEIILSTAHLSGKYACDTLEKQLMSSIDLAILGQREEIYQRYADGVRKEYSYVNDSDYSKGRVKALDYLMTLNLYANKVFSKYEEKAKRNMKKEQSHLLSISNND